MNKLIKTFLTIIVFLTTFYMNVNGQTNVSGFINSNTTWNLAGSPYIVVGNVLVSSGLTLTIEPGVIVKFDHDKALQIDGKLIAIGTPANRITFTSNQTNPAAGDWAKIHFPDASVDAVFNTAGNYISGSIMKYCDVFYGGGLGFGEIHVDMSSPYFNNCRIAYSSNAGIYCDNLSYSWIDSSSIKNCAGVGLKLDYYDLQKYIFIRNDSIENNSGGGIYLGVTNSFAAYHFNIFNCYFKGNQGAISILGLCAHYNIKINDNIFTMNTGDVVSAGGTMGFTSINCNRFINNTGKVIYLNNQSSGTVSHNIIEGNNSPGGNVITFTSGASPMLFSDNVVKNNTSNFSCLQIRPEIINNQTTKILNNEFTNNTTLHTISLQPFATPSGNFDFLDFRFNTLVNPSTQYEFYNNIPYGSSDVNIGNNYWGTTNTQHIDSVIYDYFDFANQSVVYYTQPLTEPATTDSTCAPLSAGLTALEIKDFNFILFPNPASTEITIEWGNIINGGSIEIINVVGKQLYQENIFHTSKKQIDVENFPSGIYFLKLFDGVTNYSKKIIIE